MVRWQDTSPTGFAKSVLKPFDKGSQWALHNARDEYGLLRSLMDVTFLHMCIMEKFLLFKNQTNYVRLFLLYSTRPQLTF